jgi:histidine triad (HIT) family protein
MPSCLFCRIVEGDLPADTVYEGEHAVAFLDANPLVRGHTLVVPTEHVERVGDLDPKAAARYFEPVPRIVDAVQTATGADGATLAWNDGEAAGQEVPHAHLHIVPREREDGHGPIHALFGGPLDLEDDAMAATCEAIRGELGDA